MADSIVSSAASVYLTAVLAERGALPVEEALTIFRQLLAAVRTLHADGRTHRAIGPDTVRLDPAGDAALSAPEPLREFDGSSADPESCPPELFAAGAVRLPAEIEAARKELLRAGVALDPRRIDVYQLGALLCRMVTGESVAAYLRSPKAVAMAPSALQPVIRRALGYCAAERFADCDALAAALETAAVPGDPTQALAPHDLGTAPTLLPDTTPEGDDSVLGAFSGQAGDAAGPEDGLPFERLGHYRILKRIGRGGMGDVYLGFEDDLKRQVAIKVLPAEMTRNEDFVHRFHAEATAAARLAHPNIVPIHFIGRDAGRHFFAMQYVEGESLDRLLARRGRLNVGETLAILEQCLAGLGAAHRAGLVHRDVKPGNVLLEAESGRALVADFGLVKVVNAESGVTATGVIMGTVDYIAPEQARGHEVDGRSDLYSLGVMAYRMLSGRLPFAAKTPTAMIFQHAYETPKPLAEAAPDVPEVLAALVDKLMAKDPAARFQNSAEVLADIRRFRAGEQAPRPSQIIQAPDLGRPPELAVGLRRPELGNWWRKVRDRAADLFQVHAPEFVKELQSTTQQVDGAVAEYQRRRDRLAGLVGEAQQVIEELAAQAKSHRDAAAVAARRAASASGEETAHHALKEKEECEHGAAELERQVAEQRGQLEQMRRNLAKVDATLGGLRSQRDLLKARLRMAEARLNFEGSRRPPRRRWLVPAAVLLGLAAAAGVFWLVLPHSQPAGNGPASPIAPAADLFRDAVLHMTFAKDTFYEKDGKTYVRDLSGNGNDGLCDGVAYAPQGGLKCGRKGALRLPVPLFNRQPNYTITAWVHLIDDGRTEEELGSLMTDTEPTNDDVTNFNVPLYRGGDLRVYAWNCNTRKGNPDWNNNWRSASTGAGANPYMNKEWVFLAIALENGAVGEGRLRISIEGRDYELTLQTADSPVLKCTRVGSNLSGVLGEVAVFHRFLSAEEIEAIRQRGNDFSDPHPVVGDLPVGAKAPTDDAWAKQVAALPADKQVEAVAAELKARNPDFDGNVTHRVENGVVVELLFFNDAVTDIAPVRALSGLRKLTCGGNWRGGGRLPDLSPLKDMKLTGLNCTHTQVSDLSPLKGMPLTYLECACTRVSDLSPLKGMPLTELHCDNTQVSDLAPLKGMPLTTLGCLQTPVCDLSPLEGMPLTTLWCGGTKVSDLSLLKGMPLRNLHCDFKPERDAGILRSIKTLETINDKPAVEFWKELDAK